MNDLIKQSLIKLKQKKIRNPELDLRILLKYSSKQNKEIFLSSLNFDDINISKFKKLLKKRIDRQSIAKITKKNLFGNMNFI